MEEKFKRFYDAYPWVCYDDFEDITLGECYAHNFNFIEPAQYIQKKYGNDDITIHAIPALNECTIKLGTYLFGTVSEVERKINKFISIIPPHYKLTINSNLPKQLNLNINTDRC